MIRRRAKPDGLPFRVYERRGVRVYSIGMKMVTGEWSFRYSCPITDRAQIVELRRKAITQAGQILRGKPTEGTVEALIDAWFKWQESKPLTSENRRAESTLDENKREAAKLKEAFGIMLVTDLIKADAYAYLDAAEMAIDPKTGLPRPRPEKANKEISLMRTILEYGIRVGVLETNPFVGVEKLATVKSSRYVTDYEIDLAVRVGRKLGSSRLIVALALKTAYLCVRRSVEVRALTRDQIKDDGIVWTAGKRQKGQDVQNGMIEWSPELRSTIDEALGVKRNKLAGAWFVFGNLNGQRYTKGGWKATLSKLMAECVKEAEKERKEFRAFSLQDCRPKGVSDKMERGDLDVLDATMHTSERMVRSIYDRRRVKTARPAR